MFVISNHIINKLNVPDAIVRVNLAWLKSKDEALKILNESKHDIYLDYPQGRTKPPKPTLTLQDALELSNHEKVKYFAVSNVENPEELRKIRNSLNPKVKLVPKIETVKGVNNLDEILKVGIDCVMLDKEDLFVDIGANNDVFELLVNLVREKTKNIKLLELNGVIFYA